MSSKASIRNLSSGEKLSYTNDSGKPVELTFKTATGTSMRITVGIGQTVELASGTERATLYLLEPQDRGEKLQVVQPRSDSTAGT